MKQDRKITAPPGLFRNALAPAAAVCLTVAAILGLGALVFLSDPGYHAALTEKILRSGIRTESALATWTIIHIAISILCCICPAVTVWGMWTALRGNYAMGLNFLSNAAHWLLRITRVCGALALCLFLFRAGRYLLAIAPRDDWLYRLFASVVMEGLLVVQAVFLYRLLCRFLDDCEGCAASMGYTLATGKLDPYSIPGFAATGMILLGILGLILSVDRLVTMTIASDGFKQYYKFLIAAHPAQWFCAATLFVGGIGDILLGAYLKFYKQVSERTVFFTTRNAEK